MDESNTTNWLKRLAISQPIFLQPVIAASDFHDTEGMHSYILISVVVVSGLFLNQIFIKDILAIIKSRIPIGNLMKEYLWVFIVGCMNISIFASVYHMFGIQGASGVILGDWPTSYYFSIVTWTTLGYGDFSPVENLRLVAAFEATMGYFYMAILVGLLLNISQHFNEK